MARKLKTYKFTAWVHPIKGGDDYKVALTGQAFTLAGAEKSVRAWLRKRSAVVTDYKRVK